MLLGHQKIKGDFERLIGLDRLAHGYFFFGPAGAGKRFFAEEFARSLERGSWFEKNDARPLSDALFIAPDEKDTIGIDAVRSIKLFLGERPNISKYRLVVIDRADALTTEAQNALLKITEEPPVRTLLILIAAGKESLLPTLISRLQAV
jgi:DNA polymerase-3 subunit delta'